MNDYWFATFVAIVTVATVFFARRGGADGDRATADGVAVTTDGGVRASDPPADRAAEPTVAALNVDAQTAADTAPTAANTSQTAAALAEAALNTAADAALNVDAQTAADTALNAANTSQTAAALAEAALNTAETSMEVAETAAAATNNFTISALAASYLTAEATNIDDVEVAVVAATLGAVMANRAHNAAVQVGVSVTAALNATAQTRVARDTAVTAADQAATAANNVAVINDTYLGVYNAEELYRITRRISNALFYINEAEWLMLQGKNFESNAYTPVEVTMEGDGSTAKLRCTPLAEIPRADIDGPGPLQGPSPAPPHLPDPRRTLCRVIGITWDSYSQVTFKRMRNGKIRVEVQRLA